MQERAERHRCVPYLIEQINRRDHHLLAEHIHTDSRLAENVALADFDEPTIRCQHPQPHLERSPRQRVENDIDTRAIRRGHDFVSPRQQPRIEDVFHTHRFEHRALRWRSRRREDTGATAPRNLQRRQSDAAGGGMNQHTFVRLQSCRIFERARRRQKRDRERARCIHRNAVRYSHDQCAVRDCMAAQRAFAHCHHAVAYRDIAHIAADTRDDTRAFETRFRRVTWRRGGVLRQCDKHVDEIQPGRLDTQLNLLWCDRFRLRCAPTGAVQQTCDPHVRGELRSQRAGWRSV